MSAEDFTATGTGKTAQDAFHAIRAAALHEYGHGGYTGTIAEKDSFKLIARDASIPESEQIRKVMEYDWEADEPAGAKWWLTDKWGPCACLAHDDGETFTFFGTASS